MRSGLRGLPERRCSIYIKNENVGIDVAFWFMQDARYKTEMLNRWNGWRADPNPRRSARQCPLSAQRRHDRRVCRGRHPDPLPHRARHPALEDDGLRRPEHRRVRRRQLQSDRVHLPDRRTATTRTSRSTSPTTRTSSTASRPKYDNLWLDTANYANYANITGPPARVYPIYTEESGSQLPAAGGLRAPHPQALRRGEAEDRRDHVSHHRRAAHQRDDRGACSAACRSASSARPRNIAIPSRQWVSYNMDRLWAAGIPYRVRGARRPESSEAGDPVQPGHGGLRIVELDQPVRQLPAGAQLLHDQAVDVPVVRRSVRAQVEQPRAERRDRDRLVRAAAAGQAGDSVAGRRRGRRSRSRWR